MGPVAALLAFLLGMRLGPQNSRLALVVFAAFAAAIAIWARYEWADTRRASGLLMLAGAGALSLLSAALALIGPSFFRRWQIALCLSAALVIGLFLIPVDQTMCVVLAVCPS